MGRQVYSRASYKLNLSVDADTRIFSAKMELAIANVAQIKIQNGIRDNIYASIKTYEHPNIFLAAILKDNLAVLACYDKNAKHLMPTIPDDCFKQMESYDIQLLTKRLLNQVKEYVKSYNHQREFLDNIKNCQSPLLIEDMRIHLDKLVESINLELAHRHISFDDYPPVPEHFQDR